MTANWRILLLALVASACGADEEPPAEILRPVRTIVARLVEPTRARAFSGVARAGAESRLSFKVSGTVQAVPVQVGDRVVPGRLIAQLDAEDYELRVAQMEAALERAKAQKVNANNAYQRVRELYENESASKSELDEARAASKSADASVESAQKELEFAQLQVAYTRLVAAQEGFVAVVNVEVNENVQAGTTVVELTSGGAVEVEVGVPESWIARIREGSKVQVSFDALPGESFGAIVTEVGVALSGRNVTFPVTVLLDGADSGVRSGMAAEVQFRFDSEDARPRFLVPSDAVAEDRAGRFVYVALPSGDQLATIQRHAVSVGEMTPEGFEIFEGLSDGDLVVTAGVSRIEPGLTVTLLKAE